MGDFDNRRETISRHLARNEIEAALSLAEAACQKDGSSVEDWLLLGDLRLRCGDAQAALNTFNHVCAQHPSDLRGQNRAAHALFQLGRQSEALNRLESLLPFASHDTETLVNLGVLNESLGRAEIAVRYYSDAIEHDPGNFRALLNRAAIARDADRLSDAFQDYEQLVQAWPANSIAWYNHAEALRRMGQFARAVNSADQALTLSPNDMRAMMCKGVALASQGQIATAESVFQQLHSLAVSKVSVPGGISETVVVPDARSIHLRQMFAEIERADWTRYAELVNCFERYAADEEVTSDIDLAFIAMYAATTARSSARIHGAISKFYVAQASQLAPVMNRETAALRVGYLSSKFGATAASLLYKGLFAAHDRDHVSVCLFALNPADGSPERAEIEAGADRFFDLSSCDDAAAAKIIFEQQIDVLVDLSGYGNGSRPGIMARRPAPIQVNYLGHQHSLYADFIDYRFTDRIAEPEYATDPPPEARVFLPSPHFPYCVRPPVGPKPGRINFGLPESACVFACLNTIAKIDPPIFDAWMSILNLTPGSVLWLLEPDQACRERLKGAAVARGADPDRLVFARPAAHRDHLQRLSLADVYLDTSWYGGHTTALDALHAGVPLITLTGDTLARRLGASLLASLDMPELAVDNLESYVALAVSLAQDSQLRAGFSERIKDRLASDNPFSITLAARRLEYAFRVMADNRRNGRPNVDFEVPCNPAAPSA